MQNTIDAPSFKGIVAISGRSAFLSAYTGNVAVAKVGWSKAIGRSCVDGELQYLIGARYYDPEIGIWTSQDPAGQLTNPYGYSSNPVLYIDEDGRFFWLVPIAIGLYAGYRSGKAQGLTGIDLVFRTMMGGAIGIATGGMGSAIAGAVGASLGATLGAATGGLVAGSAQGYLNAAMSGAQGGDLWSAAWKGGVTGLVGGGVGTGVGHGGWGAIAGGAAGGATGAALSGGNAEDVFKGALTGGAIAGSVYTAGWAWDNYGPSFGGGDFAEEAAPDPNARYVGEEEATPAAEYGNKRLLKEIEGVDLSSKEYGVRVRQAWGGGYKADVFESNPGQGNKVDIPGKAVYKAHTHRLSGIPSDFDASTVRTNNSRGIYMDYGIYHQGNFYGYTSYPTAPGIRNPLYHTDYWRMF
jgi:hypothetical protein